MAQGFDTLTEQPVNPATSFLRTGTIHAVAIVKNAPANTTVKAAWYANDVGAAAPCNSFIDQAELGVSGTLNVDFSLSPTNPSGDYRVEISVNGKLDRVVNFAVK